MACVHIDTNLCNSLKPLDHLPCVCSESLIGSHGCLLQRMSLNTKQWPRGIGLLALMLTTGPSRGSATRLVWLGGPSSNSRHFLQSISGSLQSLQSQPAFFSGLIWALLEPSLSLQSRVHPRQGSSYKLNWQASKGAEAVASSGEEADSLSVAAMLTTV